MLALKLNNTFLDLPTTTSASFTLNNPFFDSQFSARDFALPFTLHTTPTNVNKLGSPHRLDSKGKKIFDNAVLFLDNIPYEKGTITIKKATNKTIQIVFKNESRNLIEALEATKIREIVGYDLIQATVSTQSVFNVTPNWSQYLIVVEGISFTYVATQGDSLAHVVQQLSNSINAALPNHAIWQSGQTQLIIDNNQLPTFHFFIILSGLTIISNVTAGQNKVTQTEQYVKNIIENPVPTHTFPTINWMNLYEDKNENFEGWVNYYKNGQTISNRHHTKEHNWLHTYIPFIFLKHVLQQIANSVGLVLDESSFFKEGINDLLLFNNKTLDLIFQDITVDNQYLNSFSNIIVFGDHLPDLNALDFLNKLAEKFALLIDVQKGLLSLKVKKDLLNKKAIDWTDLAEPTYSIDFVAEKDGVLLDETREHDNYSMEEQLNPLIIGGGENELITEIGTAYLNTREGIKTPTIDQLGSTPLTGDNETDLRLLIYRGLQPAEDGELYPLATHESTNTDPTSLASIDIYNEYHAAVMRLNNKPKVTKRMRLSVAEILKLKKWDNPRRTIFHKEGTLHGVIKTVKFKATTKKITIASVEFISEI